MHMTKTSRPVVAIVLTALLALPLLASAATPVPDVGALTPYSNGILTLINKILVPLIIGLSFITFLWGMYKHFILGASEESEKAEGRKFAMWGIIGFVVILSLWGIVNLGVSILNLNGPTNLTPPVFKTN